MAAVSTALETGSASGLAFQIAQPGFLELWLNYAETSANFLNAIKAIPNEQFCDFSTLSPDTRDFITSVISLNPTIDISDFPILPFETFSRAFIKAIFGPDPDIRSELFSVTVQLLEEPSGSFVRFINNSLVDDTLVPPRSTPECPLAQSFLTLFPEALDRLRANEPVFEAFFQLIESIFFIAPHSVSLLALDLVDALMLSDVADAHVLALFAVLHHLAVLDRSLVGSLAPEVVAKLAEVPASSHTGIQMASLIREAANGSVLVGACVGFALASAYDEHSELLLRMIQGGIRPGPVAVPNALADPLALRLTNALWRSSPELREHLRRPMRAMLRLVRPAEFFRPSRCIQEAMNYVGNPH
jgi:hypothetical protein